MYKTPHLGILSELDLSSATAGPELTQPALSMLRTDGKEGEKLKSRYSVMSGDDKDDATFDAEFSDLGDNTACGKSDHLLILWKLSADFCAAPYDKITQSSMITMRSMLVDLIFRTTWRETGTAQGVDENAVWFYTTASDSSARRRLGTGNTSIWSTNVCPARSLCLAMMI